jgi:protein involved in polysaccharide export with SLBB domain
VGGLLVALAGCAFNRAHLNKAVLADHTPAAHTRDPEAAYQIRCPDVILLTVTSRPDCSGERPVGADGRIAIDGSVRLFVDGLTPAEVAAALVKQAGLPAGAVKVKVAQFRSQHLLLISPGSELQQVVPYHGPETVVDLLQRIGTIPEGSDLTDVRVIRAHVADAKPPEVFTVDLRAVVVAHDSESNIRLEPFDEVVLAQSQGSQLADCLPPWLQSAVGSKRPEPATPEKKPSQPSPPPPVTPPARP